MNDTKVEVKNQDKINEILTKEWYKMQLDPNKYTITSKEKFKAFRDLGMSNNFKNTQIQYLAKMLTMQSMQNAMTKVKGVDKGLKKQFKELMDNYDMMYENNKEIEKFKKKLGRK